MPAGTVSRTSSSRSTVGLDLFRGDRRILGRRGVQREKPKVISVRYSFDQENEPSDRSPLGSMVVMRRSKERRAWCHGVLALAAGGVFIALPALPRQKKGALMGRKILIGVAALVVLLVLIVLTRPATFHVERSMTMSAPPENAFAQVNDFHAWPAWSTRRPSRSRRPRKAPR